MYFCAPALKSKLGFLLSLNRASFKSKTALTVFKIKFIF